YMKSASFPTEETLYASYKEVLSAFKDEKVVIRTLDIGGDKPLSYLPRTHELNPFLGLRGIRFSLSYQSIFVKQLRALLKANTHGNLSIMLPMISTKEEIIASKRLVDEAILSLKVEFIEVQKPHIGIMIEVPSAALQIDVLSKQVDFVSIGTNDLLQYIFAADRMNEEVTHLYQPYHPTFLKLLKSIIDHGHQNKVEVSVCGEMASDPKQALLLIGLGIDVLSM